MGAPGVDIDNPVATPDADRVGHGGGDVPRVALLAVTVAHQDDHLLRLGAVLIPGGCFGWFCQCGQAHHGGAQGAVGGGWGLVDDVIDPRETRRVLCQALEMSWGRTVERPHRKRGVMPV